MSSVRREINLHVKTGDGERFSPRGAVAATKFR